MAEMTFVTHAQVARMVNHLAKVLQAEYPKHVKIYGVPRGGVPVAYMLSQYDHISLSDRAEDADVFIDDLVDSGVTAARWQQRHPGKGFFVLLDKSNPHSPCNGDTAKELLGAGWLHFPWEGTEGLSEEPEGIEDNIRRILQFIGEDPNREGLLETPGRVAKAWAHWTSGYKKDASKILKVFEDGADGCDEMVIVKDIPVYSKCEHHLADIFGTATVAYIPAGKIVGLSKLSRLVDMYARRLQVQERLTNQIADALQKHLQPTGVGVIIRARHLCMESRGICQQGHHTITSALRGVLKTNPAARSEFMELAQ